MRCAEGGSIVGLRGRGKLKVRRRAHEYTWEKKGGWLPHGVRVNG